MHKENCTVSLVMSERGLNMNNVIYNSGLLLMSITPSGSAPRPLNLKVQGDAQKQSCDTEGRSKQNASQPMKQFYQRAQVQSLCSRSPWLQQRCRTAETTLRDKMKDVTMRGQKCDFFTSNCKPFVTVRDHLEVKANHV